MSNLQSSKKAVGLALEQIVGLFIVGIVIVLALLIFTGFYKMFVAGPDQGTEESFKLLVQNVQTITNPPSGVNPSSSMTLPYSIDAEHSLVGFDKGQQIVDTTWLGHLGADRPLQQCPIDVSCLCLCEAAKSEKACKQFALCKQLPDIDKIQGEAGKFYCNTATNNGVYLAGNFPPQFKKGNLKIEKTGTILTISGEST